MEFRMTGSNTSKNKRWLQPVVSENDVTPEEQKDSSDVMIATRTPNRTEGATVHVNNLDIFFFVHKLADSLAVLCIG